MRVIQDPGFIIVSDDESKELLANLYHTLVSDTTGVVCPILGGTLHTRCKGFVDNRKEFTKMIPWVMDLAQVLRLGKLLQTEVHCKRI